MRVLIVTSTFPLACDDGRPRFVYDLARALAQYCRISVLAPHHPGAEDETTMGGLQIRRFRYAWPQKHQCLAYGSGMPDNLKQSWLARAQVPSYFASLALAVRKQIKSERIDVVNSHWLIPQALAVAWAVGQCGSCAHAATAHAGDVMMLDTLPGGRWISRAIVRRTDILLPVGDHVARRLRRMAGEEMTWATEPMGVDFDHFSSPAHVDVLSMPFNGNFVLFVGRLVPIKGVDVLLNAMPAVLAEDSTLGLVVVGTGAAEKKLKRKARRLGIDDRVNFTGRLTHKQILPYLHSCRVLALPSKVGPNNETEGTPTVLAEALAAGCRVVASRAGGAEALLKDGVNGWLAAANDAADLARKLSIALSHRDDEICHQARQTVRQLDWGHVAARYMTHFETAARLKHQQLKTI